MLSEMEAALHRHLTDAEDDRDWLARIVFEFLLVGPDKRTHLSTEETDRFLRIWGASPRDLAKED